MPKTSIFSLAVAAVVATCLTPAPARAQPKPALVWAADSEGGAPYIYPDADSFKFVDPKTGKGFSGFEVDLAEALGKALGRPIEYKHYEFKSLQDGLKRGDFDFIMNGWEVTGDRKRRVRFCRPYYVYRLQLVTRVGEARFATLEECKAAGAVVGTLENTAAERLLQRMRIKYERYDGQVEPYQDLALGRKVDAVLLDVPIAETYAKPNPKLKFAGPPVGKGYYAIAVRNEDATLAADIDAALNRLIENGELQRIYEKWGVWNDDQKLLPQARIDDIQDEDEAEWTLADYFPLLLEGAWLTVQITVLGFLLAMLIGLPVAMARLYGPAPLRWLATLYVEFFRGIPVLLLLVFLYFGLPAIAEHYELGVSLKLDAFQAAVLGFGLNYAAYEAEIYRAGIGAVPPGQWEAAASLGMSGPLTFRRIIFPQALRVVLPPMTNDFVALFKDTSIVSIIAVVELSKQYQILAKTTGNYLEIGLATAALYLLMSVPLGYLSRRLEQRWSVGH